MDKSNKVRENNSTLTQRRPQPQFLRPFYGSSSGVFFSIFHHCGRKRHIRQKCFQLRNELQLRLIGTHLEVFMREREL